MDERRDLIGRLRRRFGWNFDLRRSVTRAGGSIPAIVQLVVAVTVAYVISRYALGHDAPVTAVTVTLTSLGFVRDARPIRVLETAIGVTLGITLSEVILLLAGQGVWQLAVSLAVTLVVARFFSAAPGFAIVAGVQSVLVAVLPVAQGGPFSRTLDGLVGGAVALLCTALIPRDPRRAAFRDARAVLNEFTRITAELSSELRAGSVSSTDTVLEQARRTQPLIDAWHASLDSAIAIARISPLLRRHLPELLRQRVLLRSVDLAVRDLRVVVRRSSVMLRDGRPRPGIADLCSQLTSAATLLGQSLRDPSLTPNVRQDLILIAVRLDPAKVETLGPVDSTVVMELRPMLMDLLCATGLTSEEARRALPKLGD